MWKYSAFCNSTHRSVYESVVTAERSKYQQNTSVWSLLIYTIWRSEGACSWTANNRCLWPYRKCIVANSLLSDKLISSGNICVNTVCHTQSGRWSYKAQTETDLWETWRFSSRSFLVSFFKIFLMICCFCCCHWAIWFKSIQTYQIHIFFQ